MARRTPPKQMRRAIAITVIVVTATVAVQSYAWAAQGPHELILRTPSHLTTASSGETFATTPYKFARHEAPIFAIDNYEVRLSVSRR